MHIPVVVEVDSVVEVDALVEVDVAAVVVANVAVGKVLVDVYFVLEVSVE